MPHIARLLLLVVCFAFPVHASLAQDQPWHHVVGADHPWVGRIFSPDTGAFLEEAELVRQLQTADFVLLGEKHDNVDHHRLQARMINALGMPDTGPASLAVVGFEMLNRAQQENLDTYLQQPAANVEGIAAAVDWQASGWPDFSYYAPVFQAAENAGAAIGALNLTRSDIGALFGQGLAALDPELTAKSNLEKPLPPALEKDLEQTLIASHCGHGNSQMIQKMITVQRARDAMMADRLIAFAGDRKAVMIAGAGHMRRDRGVPFVMKSLAPAARVISLSFQEVPVDVDEAEGLPATTLPFDFVWFTPRVDSADPCEKYKRSLQKLNKDKAPKN